MKISVKDISINANKKSMWNPIRAIGRYWNLLAAWGGTDWYLSDLERDDPEAYRRLADDILNLQVRGKKRHRQDAREEHARASRLQPKLHMTKKRIPDLTT